MVLGDKFTVTYEGINMIALIYFYRYDLHGGETRKTNTITLIAN